MAASCEWREHLRVSISSVVPIRSICCIGALCDSTEFVSK